MFSGLGAGLRYKLVGNGRLLKLSNRSAGPRYCAQSFAVSGAVVFSIAPIDEQMNWMGLEKLLMMKAPMPPGMFGLMMLYELTNAVGATCRMFSRSRRWSART